jgi:hypothetical protein
MENEITKPSSYKVQISEGQLNGLLESDQGIHLIVHLINYLIRS